MVGSDTRHFVTFSFYKFGLYKDNEAKINLMNISVFRIITDDYWKFVNLTVKFATKMVFCSSKSKLV